MTGSVQDFISKWSACPEIGAEMTREADHMGVKTNYRAEGEQLYCESCDRSIGRLKKNTFWRHMKTAAHKNGVVAKGRERVGSSSSAPPAARARLAMESVTFRQRVLSVFLSAGIPLSMFDDMNVMRLLCRTDIKRTKLPGSSVMSQMIPQHVKNLEERKNNFLRGQPLTITMDFSALSCEAGVMTAHAANIKLQFRVPLAAIVMKEKKPNANSLCEVLLTESAPFNMRLDKSSAEREKHENSRDLALSNPMASHLDGYGACILGVSCDNEATNFAMYEILVEKLKNVTFLPCYSHMLNCLGKKISWPAEPREFMALWRRIIESHAASHVFQEVTGATRNPKKHSQVRWWSEALQVREIVKFWDHMKPFFGALIARSLVADAAARALELLDDDDSCARIRAFFICLDTAMKSTISLTAWLESDDFTACLVAAGIRLIEADFRNMLRRDDFPQRLASEAFQPILGNRALCARISSDVSTAFHAVIVYFDSRFGQFRLVGDLPDAEMHDGEPTLKERAEADARRFVKTRQCAVWNSMRSLYDALECLHPTFLLDLAHDEHVNDGQLFARRVGLRKMLLYVVQHPMFVDIQRELEGGPPGPFDPRHTKIVDRLMDELDAVLLYTLENPLTLHEAWAWSGVWWRKARVSDESSNFCTWFHVIRRALIVRTSSASAERVFSVIKRRFTKQQQSSSLDLVKASLFERYSDQLDFGKFTEHERKLGERVGALSDNDSSSDGSDSDQSDEV